MLSLRAGKPSQNSNLRNLTTVGTPTRSETQREVGHPLYEKNKKANTKPNSQNPQPNSRESWLWQRTDSWDFHHLITDLLVYYIFSLPLSMYADHQSLVAAFLCCSKSLIANR
jgi:hypothetical protein